MRLIQPPTRSSLIIFLGSKLADHRLTIGLSSALGILAVVCCAIVAVVWYRRKPIFAPQLSPNSEWQFDPNRSIEDQIAELPYNLLWEFPRLDVSLKRLIGEGNFGEVWEATAEGIAAFRPQDDSELGLRSKLSNIYAREQNENDFWVKYFRQEYYPPQYSEEGAVAVKCLKPGAPERDYTDLANELKLMIHIGAHKNIVNLMGACTQKGPLWVILEYCPFGDLRKFLRSKQLSPTWNRLEMDSPEQLCYADLIRMAMEIAEGMIFLTASGVIHRDLAARNVLVGKNMEMKVADFGMARDVSEDGEEYKKESNKAVPVRWTSPEAMNLGVYSTTSDVWAYGVTIWELFSLGHQPYGGMSNIEVKLFVEDGRRLKAPTDCPDNVYVIMKACWNHVAKERPNFCEIFEILMEVKRSAFSPTTDYYSGAGVSEQADIYAGDGFVDCRPVLREKRIKWLKNAGLSVTEENLEDLLDHMWGPQTCTDEFDGDEERPGLLDTNDEIDAQVTGHTNKGYVGELSEVDQIPAQLGFSRSTTANDIVLQVREPKTFEESAELSESSL